MITSDELAVQSNDRCLATVPITFANEDLPNSAVGADRGDDLGGWFNDFDLETTRTILKFGYDLIPLVGDGTEIVNQIVNAVSGQDVDEVSLILSTIGFALDFPSDPATVSAGGIVSGTKSIYKTSLDGAGAFARAIEDIVRTAGNPRQIVEALNQTVGTFVDLLFNGGISAIRNADEVAENLAEAAGRRAIDAISDLSTSLDYAKFRGVAESDFFRACQGHSTGKNIDNNIELNDIVDWLDARWLTRVQDNPNSGKPTLEKRLLKKL